MGREIIQIAVGQCGNQVGLKFWDCLGIEHGLDKKGKYVGSDPEKELDRVNIYYREGRDRWVPRAILCDMEQSVLQNIQTRTENFFSNVNYILNHEGCANSFMTGCYSLRALEIAARVKDAARREVERTDCCQAVQICHSAGGGTGSGLGMRIVSEIEPLMHRSFGSMWLFSVFPSKRVSNTVLEPYNCTLALDKMTTCSNVVVFDNESLGRVVENQLLMSSSSFADFNRIIAQCMAGMTASIRFSGPLNMDLNKLSYALSTRNVLHYYMISYAPLCSLNTEQFRNITVHDLIKQATDEECLLCEIPIHDEDLELGINIKGKSFANAALFRGQIPTSTVDEIMTYLKGPNQMENGIRKRLGYDPRDDEILLNVQRNQEYKLQCTRQVFSAVCDVASPGLPMSCTYLQNHSKIKLKFLDVIRSATRMYRNKAFAQWYDVEQYEGYTDDLRSLEETIDYLSTEFIADFGIEDDSNWPEALITLDTEL